MKKILLILFLFMIGSNVYAENIFDNYHLIINKSSSGLKVEETFTVIHLDDPDKYITQQVGDSIRITNSDIEDINFINEDGKYLIYKVKEDTTYNIEYSVLFGDEIDLLYFSPTNVIINNFEFVYSSERKYEVEFLYEKNMFNIVQNEDDSYYGKLLSPQKDFSFGVDIRTRRAIVETEHNSSVEPLFTKGDPLAINNATYTAVACLVISLIVGTSVLVNKGDSRRDKLMIYSAAGLLALTVILYLISVTPYLIVFLCFYCIFYGAIFGIKKGEIFGLLFIVPFLCFHSYVFWGSAFGVIAHIINHINIGYLAFVNSRIEE